MTLDSRAILKILPQSVPQAIYRGLIPALLVGFMGVPSYAQTCYPAISLTSRDAVNGTINVASPPGGCGTAYTITGDGRSTVVRLWFPYYWNPAVSKAGSVPFVVTETHGTGAKISMTGVKSVVFSDGQSFDLPNFTPSQSTSGNTPGTTPTPTPIPSATVVMPPAIAAAVASADVVGVLVQNTSASSSAAGYVTFGQVFKQGAVQVSNNLLASSSGTIYPVQMDAQALWPDGSVKFAAVTLRTPAIAGNGQLPVMLSKTSGLTANKLNLATSPLQLFATLNFSSGQYAGSRTIDLGNALRTALGSAPDYWLNGALATQARVDVPLPGGPMHLTADVTVHADQSITADVQFNNDLTSVIAAHSYANPAALPPQNYSATITLNGVAQTFSNITQYQYQDWHAVVSTVPASSLNVQRDLAYLEHAGAVLPYDRTTGVSSATLQNYQASIINAAGFGKPLAVNGITQYMPQTGGRADIGYTTQYNAAWLMTQDIRAAKVALAQGDSGGAIPWNVKLANGHWLTKAASDNALHVWIDSRADQTTVANQQPAPAQTGWTTDTAHQPNLAYVPYLMTGARWYLDRLNAQAAFALASTTWVDTCTGNAPYSSGCDIVISVPGQQVRSQAWNMREIQEAAFIGKTGSWEQAYFSTVVQHNWDYMQFVVQNVWTDPWSHLLRPALNAAGSTAGWVAGVYGNTYGIIPEWQQDYMTGVAVQGAQMGFAGAKQFINWQKDTWLAGRFIGQGMNPHDGCNYNLVVADPNTRAPYTSWATIEAKTAEAQLSEGAGWAQGDYCQLARAVLGGALTLYPSDTQLQQALNWLNQAGAPYTSAAAFQADPTFNIVPLQ
jgi:YetA-like protein